MKHRLMSLVLMVFLVIPAQVLASASASVSQRPAEEAVKLYNEGIEMIRGDRFFFAEMRLRGALKIEPEMAEAHNNLAFVLREQGSRFHTQALRHYASAIEINPELPEPYMSRGVLHVQRGNMAAARRDLARLVEMDSELAQALEQIIEEGEDPEPELFRGLSPSMAPED